MRYTKEMTAWLADNYKSCLVPELTKKFNRTFQTELEEKQIRNKLQNEGMTKKRYYNDDEKAWVLENLPNYTTMQDLADAFNKHFGTNKKDSNIREFVNKRLHIRSGYESKTSYKYKEKEETYKVGDIVNRPDGYKYIKVKSNKGSCKSGYRKPYWLTLQEKVYQDAYGSIKNNQYVVFLDGDKKNYEISNLYPITHAVGAIMSKHQWWTSSKEHTLTAIKVCELMLALKGQ